MKYVKQIITFTIAFAILVASVVNAGNFTAGARQENDSVACNGNIDISAKIGKNVSTQAHCNLPRRRNITLITATDRGSNGTAKITAGGLNQSHVTLEFKSQIGQPLNFTIKVYALKATRSP